MAFIPESKGTVSSPVSHQSVTSGSVLPPNDHGTSSGTNLVLYSEQFDNAAWNKVTTNGASLQANASISPDGTTTADLYKAGTVDAFYSIDQPIVIPNSVTYTFSIYVKRSGFDHVSIRPITNANSGAYTIFDLANGVVVTEGTFSTARITPAANGYYRVSVSLNSGIGSTTNRFVIDIADASGAGVIGDGTKGLLLWGAMIEVAKSPSSYIKTLSTAKTAGSVSVPVSHTAKTAGSVSAPVSHTAKTAGSVSAPVSHTAKTAGSIAFPNTPTAKTAGSVSAPVSHTAKTAGSIAVPVSHTAKTAGSVSAPVSHTAKTAGSVSAPVSHTAKTAGSIAVPVSHTALTQNPIPRALTPRLNLDFANGLYSKCGANKTFDDLFTYTRSSSATFWDRRLNDCGQYEYFLNSDFVGNVTNLVTYSEDLTNAAWTKSNSTIASNATSGFNSEKMDKFESTYIGTSPYVLGSYSTSISTYYTISIDVKSGTVGTSLRISLSGNTPAVYFDPSNGQILQVNTGFDANSEYLGNGVYRLTFTQKTTVANGKFYIQLSTGIAGTVQIGDYVYINRAQLTESAKALPYVKTISTSVTKAFTESPRIEYNPLTGENKGVLIEGGGTNTCLQSENADLSPWTLALSSVTANAEIAPDGTKSADLILDNTTSGEHRLDQSGTITSDGGWTRSCYLKPYGNIDRVFMRIGNSGGIRVNLLTGLAENSDGIHDLVSFDFLPDGWVRLAVYKATAVTTDVVRINCIDPVGGINTNYSGSGTGTDGFHHWGSQVENLPFASSYIRTEASAVSRSADNLEIENATNGQLSGSLFFDYSINGLNVGKNQYIARLIYDTSNQISAIMSGTTAKQRVYAQTNGVVVIDNSVPTVDATIVNTQTRWSVSYGGNQMSFYKDGVLKYTDLTVPPISKNLPLNLTISINNAELFGHVKNAKLYDQALTDQEVSLL